MAEHAYGDLSLFVIKSENQMVNEYSLKWPFAGEL
jgi:hypothetical protein